MAGGAVDAGAPQAPQDRIPLEGMAVEVASTTFFVVGFESIEQYGVACILNRYFPAGAALSPYEIDVHTHWCSTSLLKAMGGGSPPQIALLLVASEV